MSTDFDGRVFCLDCGWNGLQEDVRLIDEWGTGDFQAGCPECGSEAIQAVQDWEDEV